MQAQPKFTKCLPSYLLYSDLAATREILDLLLFRIGQILPLKMSILAMRGSFRFEQGFISLVSPILPIAFSVIFLSAF